MKTTTKALLGAQLALVGVMILGCSSKPASEINLEKLTKAFEATASTKVEGKPFDAEAFEAKINDPKEKIYQGKGKVEVELQDSGEVVGFKDTKANGIYDKVGDAKVFSIQADQDKKEVVAADEHSHHYRHRPASGFFTGYLIGSMLTRQRGYYGGRYWSAPSNARYMSSGYYGKSVRSGSRTSSRRGGRSGGFSFGK